MKHIIYVTADNPENNMTITCSDTEDMAHYAVECIKQGYKEVRAVREEKESDIEFLEFAEPEKWHEWGEIEHPHYGMVMTYWPVGTLCYNSYSKPIVHKDGEVEVLNYDHDEGCWGIDSSFWYDLTHEELIEARKNGI